MSKWVKTNLLEYYWISVMLSPSGRLHRLIIHSYFFSQIFISFSIYFFFSKTFNSMNIISLCVNWFGNKGRKACWSRKYQLGNDFSSDSSQGRVDSHFAHVAGWLLIGKSNGINCCGSCSFLDKPETTRNVLFKVFHQVNK